MIGGITQLKRYCQNATFLVTLNLESYGSFLCVIVVSYLTKRYKLEGNMEDIIKQAIDLRKAAKYQESRALLETLLNDEDYAAKAHLQIAWSYDNEGKEEEAIGHYLSSLSGTLSSVERFDALFGLASTYRSLGNYSESLVYFEKTISEYPESIEVQPFYAMCLYNLERHKEATSLLLRVLVSTTNSAAIKEYQRAILLYAEDLDKKWQSQ